MPAYQLNAASCCSLLLLLPPPPCEVPVLNVMDRWCCSWLLLVLQICGCCCLGCC